MVTIGEKIVNLIEQHGGVVDDLTIYQSGIKRSPESMRNRLRYYLGIHSNLQIYQRRKGIGWYWCTEEHRDSDTHQDWERV